MPPHSLEYVLALLKEHLFRAAQSREGVVLLAPGRLIDGSGLNLMVIGDSKPRAQAHLEAVISLLTRGALLPVSEPFPL